MNVVNMINADTRIESLRSWLLKRNVKKNLRCHDILILDGGMNYPNINFLLESYRVLSLFPYCTFFGFAVLLMS